MKKLLIFGDSISTRSHGNGGYVKLLEETQLFDTLKTYAVSASGLTSITPNPLIHLLSTVQSEISEATHIIIWHGTNDWYYHVSTSFFIVELKKVHDIIRKINPTSDILYITPLIRYQATFGNILPVNGYEDKNNVNETLLDYERTIIQFGESHQCHVLCMRSDTRFTMSTIDLFFEDRVHPNKKGYQVIFKSIHSYYSNR